MSRHLQIGMRRRTASPRRLALRLLMLDLSNGVFKKLADSFDDPALKEEKESVTRAFELPLTDERQETTGGTRLDAASIHSLRSMFLLLDEWDRASEARKSQNSSENREILIDTKTN